MVIDDERADRDALSATLRMLGCRVDAAENREGALSRARGEIYDLAFVDLMLGAESGVDLVPALIAANPNLHVVVVTAFGSIDTAVRAVKAGATEYVQKPIDPLRIKTVVERASEEARLAAGISAFERGGGGGTETLILSSRTPAMQTALAVVQRAAASDIPVLLRGESGTGKGALAEALHRQSDRAKEPFVTVNCPSLTDELLSSELFGHVKGSFTGAIRDQQGKVETADGGTLFLDELGDLSPTIQAKLLRFLHEKKYERVGDTHTRLADVRIVAATNRDLEAQVKAGRFREDLLYRLNVVEIALPALRERPDDLLDFARHFLTIFCRAGGRPVMELSPSTSELLLGHPWPGNIRELRNEIQRVTVLWPSRTIEPDAFSIRLRGQAVVGPRIGGEHSLANIENEHIRQVLAKADTFEAAAVTLGIEPSTLWRKRRKLGL
ncbi:alginate biosynthesis transcriptional regulatory protein AlgB [Planctomycetota bacterium]|nr:alginate biosynthesis transcriptional regulatory protein AlgB [Planctomycetota bacterium]